MSKESIRNLTISGLPGSGSTTLLNQLREHSELQFHGWTGYSGGAFMRNYAKERGLLDEKGGLHHSADIYSDDFDREVDMGMREKLMSEKHWIIESWLAGFLAQQVQGVFKVLLKCSNTAVKVDRIVNRDAVAPEEALANMNKRYKANVAKWRRMYDREWQEWVVAPGTMQASDPIDFWHPNLYDIVIDTYSTNQKETVEQVIHAIQDHLAS